MRRLRASFLHLALAKLPLSPRDLGLFCFGRAREVTFHAIERRLLIHQEGFGGTPRRSERAKREDGGRRMTVSHSSGGNWPAREYCCYAKKHCLLYVIPIAFVFLSCRLVTFQTAGRLACLARRVQARMNTTDLKGSARSRVAALLTLVLASVTLSAECSAYIRTLKPSLSI